MMYKTGKWERIELSPNIDLTQGAECAAGAVSANAAASAGLDGGAGGNRSCGPARGPTADHAAKDNAENFAKILLVCYLYDDFNITKNQVNSMIDSLCVWITSYATP